MREVLNLNTKWAFSKEADQVPEVMPQRWYWVNLPHCWNAIDGQDGGLLSRNLLLRKRD